jgi:predicted transcriptional regulator
MGFGSQLRKLRKKKGYTQGMLANAAGVSRESIQKYEVDANRPPIEVVVALADTFGICVDRLVRGEETCPIEQNEASALARRILGLNADEREAIEHLVEVLERNKP